MVIKMESSIEPSHAEKINRPSKTVLIAGGSGFIGRHLAVALNNQGYQVDVVGRNASKINKIIPFASPITWASLADCVECASKYEIIVNLTGHSIAAGRWTSAQKKRLLNSRIDAVEGLIRYCTQTHFKGTFINASAIGFYGDQGDKRITEGTTPVDCYSHGLCAAWEASLKPLLDNDAIRVCVARFGVVMSNEGGAFSQMALPFKAKVALQNGNGQQWFSWIALEDAVRALIYLIESTQLAGAYNIVAPEPLTNKTLTAHLAAHYHTLLALAAPAPFLKLAMGQMAEELLLASQRVVPSKLQQSGFTFKHNEITSWLKTL